MTMKLAVMTAAERHGELVADLAAERPALGKSQVMGVAGLPTADQTGLLRHKAHMVVIADAPRLWMGENRFVDGLATLLPFWLRRTRLRNGSDRFGWRRGFRTTLRPWQPSGVMDGEGLKLGAEGLLDMFGVDAIELVLVGQSAMRPFGGLVRTADIIEFAQHLIAQAA